MAREKKRPEKRRGQRKEERPEKRRAKREIPTGQGGNAVDPERPPKVWSFTKSKERSRPLCV